MCVYEIIYLVLNMHRPATLIMNECSDSPHHQACNKKILPMPNLEEL